MVLYNISSHYNTFINLQIKLLLSVVRAYDVPVRCDMDPLQSQSNLQLQVRTLIVRSRYNISNDNDFQICTQYIG